MIRLGMVRIGNIGDVTVVTVDVVFNRLNSSIGEQNLVTSVGFGASAAFLMSEVQRLITVVDLVSEGVLSVVILVAVMTVAVSGQLMNSGCKSFIGDESSRKSRENNEKGLQKSMRSFTLY